MTEKRANALKRNLTFSKILLCSFLLSYGFQGATQGKSAVYADTVQSKAIQSTQLQQSVDSILNPYVTNGTFSGEVLLARHGSVFVDKAYGYANGEQKQLVTTSTRFAIGALTQGFTAVAIMQLQDKGLLNVTDPVSKYIPEAATSGRQITIHELLTHTSGFPDSSNPAAEPGTEFRYSILNYLLLGQIIENVSGESYASYVQQNILTPLGMNNTGFVHKMSDVQSSATGYVPSNNILVPISLDASNFASSDGMYSTADDMYIWDQALYSGKLVPKQDLEQIFTPDLVSEITLKSYGYGYGWQVSLDKSFISNESTFGGFHSLFVRDVKDDATLILLSNEDISPLDEIVYKLGPLLLQASIPTEKANRTVTGQAD